MTAQKSPTAATHSNESAALGRVWLLLLGDSGELAAREEEEGQGAVP